MHKSELKSNGPQGLLPTGHQQQSSGLKTMRRLVPLCCAVSLMLLAPVLQGCATKSTLPCEPPPPVLMPAPSQPEPAVSYLLSAQTDILTWQAKLRAMFQTTAPL